MKATASAFLSVMMVFITVSARTQPGSTIPARFREYNSRLFQEKLFVHTDKDLYLAGELVWFRLYLSDAYTNRPSILSKLAYVEILDGQGQPVAQAKISTLPGESHGSFLLPLSMNTGMYTLRAYTSWMKNSGAAVYFEKKLTVLNTLKPGDISDTTEHYFAGLYPEGGDLVSGLESRVAFKVTDSHGHGVPGLTGFIVGDKTDTLAHFITGRSGNGSFDVLPVTGRNYRVIFILPNGQQLATVLPNIKESGYVMRLTATTEGHLKLAVMSKGVSGKANLFIQAHHVAQKLIPLSLEQGRAEINLDERELAEGINQLTIFDGNDRPVSERLYFRQPASFIKAGIETDKKTYGRRENVKLSFSLDSMDKISPASLSLSVARVYGEDDGNDIIASTWLCSELKGEVETPSFYFTKNEESKHAADLLMLTQGWRRFRWEDILKGKAIKYPLEFNGQIITGKLVNETNDAAVKNIPAFLSVPGRQFRFSAARTDSLGNIAFEVKEFYGPSEIIVRTNRAADSMYRFVPFSPYSDDAVVTGNGMVSVSPSMAEWLTRESISMQVQHVFYPDRLKSFSDKLPADTLPFYGKSPAKYMLDDYTRFTTMEEVLREYVKEVNVIARNGKLHLKVFNDDVQQFFEEDVLVLIDGVPLPDHDAIFDYDPLRVKKLTVLPRSYLLGPAVFSSIISLETYNGKYEGLSQLDRQMVAVDYEGLQAEREFYAPAYPTEAAIAGRLPDGRSTLAWYPELSLKDITMSGLHFYNSDLPGRYMVLVQGLTRSGHPVAGRCYFEVGKP